MKLHQNCIEVHKRSVSIFNLSFLIFIGFSSQYHTESEWTRCKRNR